MFTMQGLRDHVGIFSQETQNENLSKDLFYQATDTLPK